VTAPRLIAFLLATYILVAGALADDRLAIVGATLIDGTGGPAIPNAVVVIAGDRIVSVGQGAPPGDATILRADGKYLIPGLIDAHVHLSRSGSLYSNPGELDLRSIRDWATEEVPETREALPATLARYVAAGVTSVIDRGGPRPSIANRALAESLTYAPRVAVAGPMLATYRRDRSYEDGDPTATFIQTADQARALVRANAAAGVDMIKVHFLPPADGLAVALDWFVATVDEARAHGLPVTVHATEAALARAVIDAGASQLVHSIDDVAISDDLAGHFAAAGMVYTTTLLVFEGYREVFGRRLDFSDIEIALGDPRVIASLDDLDAVPRRLLPPWVAQYGAGSDGRLRVRVDKPYWMVRNVRTLMAGNLVTMSNAGVTIAAGTDAGTVGNLHGPALHRELELMVEAGLTPAVTLRAATLGGATAMGRPDDLGTIAPGKLADMVLLDADPLGAITNTRQIHRVFLGGRVVDPAALSSNIITKLPQ
jgi:imidazolonepropionase-like amidohydrolase